jgi:AcrR family transcriptional regulator
MHGDPATDETRQRIIEAATALFGETGYSRASTRAIAERAGVNEVTIFRHFGNKETLLVACIEAGNQTGFAHTFQSVLTGDYAADVRALGRLNTQDTLQRFELLRLLLCDAMTLPNLQEALVMGAAANRAQIAAYFRAQIAAGVVRTGFEPELLALAFDSLFSSIVLFARFTGIPSKQAAPDDAQIDALARLFVQGTIAEEGE